jgi:hypothetical protein
MAKPTLRRWDGQWECFGINGSCLAETFDKAWFNYLAFGPVTLWRKECK